MRQENRKKREEKTEKVEKEFEKAIKKHKQKQHLLKFSKERSFLRLSKQT